MASGVRIALDALHERGDLIDRFACCRAPGPPLLSVDRSKFAVLVGPFVPNSHTVLVEIADILIPLHDLSIGKMKAIP